MAGIEPLHQLNDLLARLDELALGGGPTPAFLEWRGEAEAAIRRIFGDASREAAMFGQIRYTPQTHSACLSDNAKEIAFQRGLCQARRVLECLLRQLEQGSP